MRDPATRMNKMDADKQREQTMMDKLRNPDMDIEYDRVRRMTPDERAADAAQRLVLRPQYEQAERDAGVMSTAERTMRKDQQMFSDNMPKFRKMRNK